MTGEQLRPVVIGAATGTGEHQHTGTTGICWVPNDHEPDGTPGLPTRRGRSVLDPTPYAAEMQSVSNAAGDLLRRHGWMPGEVLGSGVEGTVLALSSEMVAKVWHGRSPQDIERLHQFTTAVARAELPFGTPRIVDVLRDENVLITVERRLPGEPMRPGFEPEPPAASEAEAACLTRVLGALAGAETHRDMAVLPVLPGEPAFDDARPFAHSLADLVEQQVARAPGPLSREFGDLDALVAATASSLRSLPSTGPHRLVHGDLIPGNVLVNSTNTVVGVLDFGFFTTLGDPAFDAALTASIFDMYGPRARASESLLDEAFRDVFGHDVARLDAYRAAYALSTANAFSPEGTDGHFAWCVQMLRRPEVIAAVRD